MKCLSLKQPFADMVVDGKKSIELRTWNTKFRGRFLIHASGNVDADACDLFGIQRDSLVKRAVIGEAVLYEVKKYNSDSELLSDKDKHLAFGSYFDSRYGFLLKDALKFDKPVPMPGKLGFFDVEITVP
jgi:predicted transcriptional regulator